MQEIWQYLNCSCTQDSSALELLHKSLQSRVVPLLELVPFELEGRSHQVVIHTELVGLQEDGSGNLKALCFGGLSRCDGISRACCLGLLIQ